jgi:hypothetical protein
MENQIAVTNKSVMQVSYDDALVLTKFLSEGQQKISGMRQLVERFPSVMFLKAEDAGFVVIGAERDVNNVRDSIYNARKFAVQYPSPTPLSSEAVTLS